MKNRNFLCKIVFITIYLSAAVFVSAQDDEPPSRSISSLDFQTQRPKTNLRKGAKSSVQPKSPVSNQKRRKNIDVVTNPGRRYNLVRRVPAAKPRNSQASSVAPSKTGKVNSRNKPLPLKNEKVGVTFWRLRELESYERDDAPTFPVKTKKGVENWTAERVGSTTKFKVNSLVRFTIESPRSGFLYIVNREVYADGSRGEAKLIFPTLKTNSKGENRVVAGSLIEVPHSSARTPYFRVASEEPDYAGEEVVVIISPVRLPGLKIDLEPSPVAVEKLEKWLADWGTTVDIFEAADGEGVALTQVEEEAAQTRALTPEEPSPQTIYSLRARANQPLLIVFQMQARK
ncbi:MAG TPA: hypothetical protein VF599_04365 [Pyrinomonadaceae bacterium]